MRRSKIFETVYNELIRKNKTNTYFTRNDLRDIISIHQKYSSFVYKHSDLKNFGKMTLFFKRGNKIDGLISFKIDHNILKEYNKNYGFI